MLMSTNTTIFCRLATLKVSFQSNYSITLVLNISKLNWAYERTYKYHYNLFLLQLPTTNMLLPFVDVMAWLSEQKDKLANSCSTAIFESEVQHEKTATAASSTLPSA